ncbi:hypothetical protein ACQJBY_067906 [Aegilops geniculata]
MVHGAATSPALPTGSPPPPPPPPAAWIPPSTPTHDAVAAGPSLRPPGYAPVPMRSTVNAEEALAFISAPSGASGVVRLGVGMEGAAAAGTPQQETAAGSSSRAERRFGRLFGRAVAALDRRPGRRPGSWASADLGFTASPLRQASTVVVSSSDEEASSVSRR